MPDTLLRVIELLEQNSLRLLFSLGVLFVGWILSLVLSGLLRKALQRAKVERWLGKITFYDERGKTVPVERWIARIVFYLLMAVVLVAFFEVLGLTLIKEPLDNLLAELATYAPRLLVPAVLFLVAWVLASVLRMVVIQVMGNTRLRNLLAERVEVEGETEVPFIRTLGNTVYWVVFLIFSLAILESLHLEALLGPLRGMLQATLAFFPNVLAALAIFAFGWFLARVVQRIVNNLLVTVGADKLSEQAGLKNVLGRQSLAHLLSLVAYVIVLIPVLIASLNALELETVTSPANQMLGRFMAALPAVFAALLVLLTAFLIGRLLAGLVTNLLTSAGFNTILDKVGVARNPKDFNAMLARLGVGEESVEGKKTPSELVGDLLLIAILLFAGIEALNLLGFRSLALLLTQFTEFAGQVLLGLAVFFLGLLVSHWVSREILISGTVQAQLLALVARISILALAIAMALRQMGLANEIITLAFGLVLGAVCVAVAIAFGIGGKDIAGQLLRSLLRSLQKPRTGRPDV